MFAAQWHQFCVNYRIGSCVHSASCERYIMSLSGMSQESGVERKSVINLLETAENQRQSFGYPEFRSKQHSAVVFPAPLQFCCTIFSLLDNRGACVSNLPMFLRDSEKAERSNYPRSHG